MKNLIILLLMVVSFNANSQLQFTDMNFSFVGNVPNAPWGFGMSYEFNDRFIFYADMKLKSHISVEPDYYEDVETPIRTGCVCNDGTVSEATGSGACAWHGGVAYWLQETINSSTPVSIFGLVGIGYSKVETVKMSMRYSAQDNDYYDTYEEFKNTGINLSFGIMGSWKNLTLGLGYDTFPSGMTFSVGVNVFGNKLL